MKPRMIKFMLFSVLCCACAAPSAVHAQQRTPPPAPMKSVGKGVVIASPPAAAATPALLPAVAPVAPPVVSGDDVGEPNWKRYTYKDLGFSAAFPASPKVESEPNSGFGTEDTHSHNVSVEADEGVYMFFCLTNAPLVAEKLSNEYREKFLDGAWKGFIGGMATELKKNGLLFDITPLGGRAATLSGLQSQEQDFKFGPLQGRARIALMNNRMYIAVTMLSGDASAKQRDAFFESIRIPAARP